jgi:hypothetical protein
VSRNKTNVVSFKADAALIKELDKISNRSEFIRGAVLAALDSACPLCGGTGLLSPSQKRHWDDFNREHSLEKCEDCQEMYLICRREA